MIRKLPKRILLDVIKNVPEMRSIFGKRELEIIQKQVLGIKLLPSEQMRLSRDIKKKFRAISMLSDFNDIELKKGSYVKTKIEEIKEEILNSKYYPKIVCIYLFGSTATGNRTIRSDIDIAVEFELLNKKETREFRIKLNYDEKIDVKVYNLLPAKMKEDIKKYGKILWKRKIK